MNDNVYLDLFKNWVNQYENCSERLKELIEERMKGFITCLELSDKNTEANKCKELYAKALSKNFR